MQTDILRFQWKLGPPHLKAEYIKYCNRREVSSRILTLDDIVDPLDEPREQTLVQSFRQSIPKQHRRHQPDKYSFQSVLYFI